MSKYIGLHQKFDLTHQFIQAAEAYSASHRFQKIQIGSGSNILEGWLNTDVVPAPNVFFLDTTKRFPIDEKTFDYIYSEHHIEHLTYQEGVGMTREAYRILKPGGKMRIATPNLAVLLSLYEPSNSQQQEHYMEFITNKFIPYAKVSKPIFVINNAFHNWGHRFLYDRETLQMIMEEVGFVDIIVTKPGESSDEQLCRIEKHGRFIGDEEINCFETMVLEGKRPL
jgi:predicted SAM-dependent methyltransferase